MVFELKFDILFDYILENMLLNKYTSLEELPLLKIIKDLNAVGNALFNLHGYRFGINSRDIQPFKEYSEQRLSDINSRKLREFKRKYFYANMISETMYYMPDYLTFGVPDGDGFPVGFPDKIKSYIMSLYDMFEKIGKVRVSPPYEKELPYEYRVKFFSPLNGTIVSILMNIITGRFTRGINLYKTLYYRIPENKRIKFGMLISEPFSRLFHMEADKIILLNDDINSIDFKLAFLDHFRFCALDNKLLYVNKVHKYRQRYAAKIIDEAIRALFKRAYG